jgi:hypothetical protein
MAVNEKFDVEIFWEDAEGLIIVAEVENENGVKVKEKFRVGKYQRGNKLVELIPAGETNTKVILKTTDEIKVISIVK